MSTEHPVELGLGEYESGFRVGIHNRWEHLEFDSTTCSRGHLCPGYDRTHGVTPLIGGYIGPSGHDGVADTYVWNAPWYFPSAPGMAMCGECAELVDDVDYEEAVFTGDIADASWFIDRAPEYTEHTGLFYAWVGYFSPDGGLDHEIELGVHATVGAARTAIAVWGGERNRELAAIEEELDAWLVPGNPDDPENCSVCGLPDNCGDCNHHGTPHEVSS